MKYLSEERMIEFVEKLNHEDRMLIDSMSYEDLLRRWRFAPVGDRLFQGMTGQYYKQVMQEKHRALPDGEHGRISKLVGWEE